ncbi:hypothetical protein, conserved in T. vivax [Trypanosoma vivax Y486]|uniref:Uncharacterized protein n=1 Tax=Trypanosoma vivax (strain Y486) TaxID=1055687 RepID=F9WVB4_TRYVY|nr:hypothetical protein, conserved in T. vivax [Trypanosoma vivax Y486]|eukprot:CCD21521.1 hypothetical protein, conserved in T. vivax [Trypanosoma vivax Y486]
MGRRGPIDSKTSYQRVSAPKTPPNMTFRDGRPCPLKGAADIGTHLRGSKLGPFCAATVFGQPASSNTKEHFKSALFLYILAAPSGNRYSQHAAGMRGAWLNKKLAPNAFRKALSTHSRPAAFGRMPLSNQTHRRAIQNHSFGWQRAKLEFRDRARCPNAFARPYGTLCSVLAALVPRAALRTPGQSSIKSLTLFRDELIDAFRFSEWSFTNSLFAEFF